MTIIESVRNYINQFNGLEKWPFYINFLDSQDCYNIEETQSETVLETDVTGLETRQFLFVFASIEPFGKEIADQIEASTFYDDFSKWLRNNDKNGIYPTLDAGLEPVSIKTLGSGYIFESEGSTARYQIQCQFIYTEV